MIREEKFYVVEKNRGIVRKLHPRGGEGWSALFTWNRPRLSAEGMSELTADGFIERWEKVGLELRKFKGSDFSQAYPKSFDDFAQELFPENAKLISLSVPINFPDDLKEQIQAIATAIADGDTEKAKRLCDSIKLKSC